ncbi:invasion associated locus B family protein [Phyllobacterium salinisoli]|uniref:Invasion associated locus B family protein n=1 Tax=Phyllobacterium salinisoli TaxID=1899321 RepID=A0A368K502_9HYPH|nr:invasion associated locus B family protein [Phyllobacterium salinisoli]RCS23452.1 invasion associated locus B family protein [Phyllobacterium salinisoli]
MAILIKSRQQKRSTTIFTAFTLLTAAGGALVLTGTRPAPAQSEAPTALSETFGDWLVNCQTSTQNDIQKRNCQMTQEQVDGKSGQRVLMIALGAPDAKTGVVSSTLVLPFGLDLSKGVQIKVDDVDLANARISTCLPQGCIAPLSLDSKALAALSKGKQAVIGMSAFTGGQDVTGNLSLKGFGAAAARLTALTKS